MLIILPLACFALFFLILRNNGIDWRTAVLIAAVFWGACVVLITETLSLFSAVSRGPAALSWLAIGASGVICLRRQIPRRPIALTAKSWSAGLDPTSRALLLGIGLLVVLVGVIAIVSPPNIWDAMEYHLPRVAMWMSNRSVRFFATPDYAQLIFGPWAEFAMMHTILLWGSDRLVNLIEYFSLAGSVAGVSLIAKLLGAGGRGQVLAAVACGTIAEGILEASGPMNTYVLSFWIVATVAFLLTWKERHTFFNAICIGLASGLAVLTKGSAYIFLPFLALACWCMWPGAARMRFLKLSPVVLIPILALNLPQGIRCYELTGSPLGLPFPDAGPTLHWAVGRVSAAGTMANLIRNATLHLVTPFAPVNAWTERGARIAIQKIGADPDDPASIWPTSKFFVLDHTSLHEIYAGNLPHLVLLVLCTGLALRTALRTARRGPLLYALGIVGAAILFSALLRWQIWGGRHHLPLFAIGSALIGLFLENHTRLGVAAAVLLLIYALPFTLANHTRSLIRWHRVDDIYRPRPVSYFSDQHEDVAQSYIAAANAINRLNCDAIAFDSYVEGPESRLVSSPKSFFIYPLLSLIHADGSSRIIWYTGVHNWSNRYAYRDQSRACAVVCLDCARIPDKLSEYRSAGWQPSVFDDIVVFRKSAQAAERGAQQMRNAAAMTRSVSVVRDSLQAGPASSVANTFLQGPPVPLAR